MSTARFLRAAPKSALAAVAGGLVAVATGACGAGGAAPTPVEPLPADPAAVAPAALPPPRPVAEGQCDYLPVEAVEAVNGERVGAVRISADRPYPACFFLRGDGAVQLRSWIVVDTPQVARATVDAAAPVATSDLAELPGGWSGGSQPTADGAVFAVARHGTAVVVTTNQRQTISARRIAGQVIATLGL
ncbi:MAG: DUF2020 domain-containing protein [Pseudonocardiaceae bacterium]